MMVKLLSKLFRRKRIYRVILSQEVMATSEKEAKAIAFCHGIYSLIWKINVERWS